MAAPFPILLIDDDPLLLDILVRAAKTIFPEALFRQSLSLHEARPLLSNPDQYYPKLVLLDLDLGEQIDGIDFLAVLRTQPQTRLLPVVILTHSQLPNPIEAAYSSGASSFTVKPFDYPGWTQFMINLRLYWFATVTLPPAPRKQY